ncbi:MAG: VOC family protein [Gemmatimonadaceae bacterium]
MPHGKICYIEMSSKDPKTSADFYSRIFGWNVRTRGDGEIAFDDATGYVSGTWVPETKAGAGSMLTYIMVDSIDEALRRISAAGGSIVKPFTSLGDGTGFAIFQDPAGNKVGLYEERPKAAQS